MNLDYIFKFIVAVELIVIVALCVRERSTMRLHLRSTLAGGFVIAVTVGINLFFLARTGRFQDVIAMSQFLAVGLGFLISADAKE